MEKLVDTRELERDLRATLSAQREIGPDYDRQLIEAFMQKVNQQPFSPAAHQEPPLPNTAFGLRLLLAILSLVFLIPLSAITTANSGLAALIVVGFVVLGINLAFNLRG
ncbi:MAG TPA: hypothetical protein VH599_09190 [Ktedonobacterales bacterium]|jgi:hypothetical protein